MTSLLGRLARAVPDRPRRRYNTFTGTNLWKEWRAAALDLLRRDHAGEAAIRAYESAFATAAGCRHAFSFGAGRMALYVLLEALGLKPGDEVILPGFTCAVVPNALLYRGLVPVYSDIDPLTFNLDPELVEAKLTPRTRALCLQHTFGTSADAGRLRAIAAAHGLFVIEDAAHSLGARWRGQPHGSLGDVAFFSTDRTKVVNTLLGGVVTTNDETLARRLAALQAETPFLRACLARRILFTFLAEFIFYHPAFLWLGRPVMGALRRLGPLFYWRDELSTQRPDWYPYPCRLSSGQARLGASQIEALPRNLAHRRTIARWLEERISWNSARAATLSFDDQTWLRYSFLVRDRDAFVRRLASRIEIMPWFTSVIYCRDADLQEVGYATGSCPVAETVAAHIVNFPTHPRIPLSLFETIWGEHGAWIESQVVRPEALLRDRTQPRPS